MAGGKPNPFSKTRPKDSRKPILQSRKQAGKKVKATTVSDISSFFQKTDRYLDKHISLVFWTVMLITTVFSLLLFDIRFSIAGDDSTYVVRAADFLAHFIYPGFSGPLYPIMLSPVVAIFGIHAIPLKSLSLVFMIGFMYFTFKSFKGRISSLLLIAVLILVSVNSFVLYYASQTYSEAFFMFIQALTFYVFFTLFIARETDKPLRALFSHHILLSVCVLMLVLTRNIGLSAIIVISAYFLIKLQWKNLLLFIITFTIIFACFQGLKTLVWGSSEVHFTGQFENSLSKNYYDPGSGREDLQGFVKRIVVNSDFYLSDALYAISGFRDMEASIESIPVLSVFTLLLIIASIIISFRKNKYLLFTGIYVVVFILFTFLLTQTDWRQSRLIIPFFPLILLLLLSVFFSFLNNGFLRKFQWIFPLLIVIIFSLEIKTSVEDIRIVRKIEGKYYGLTPDWENYCRISQWASENLPGNAYVACRKPSISFMYGNGKRFFGITRINETDGDPLLQADAQKNLNYYFISTSSIEGHSVSNNIIYAFKLSLVGFGMSSSGYLLSNPFYIMKFPDSLKEKIFREMKKYNIQGTDNTDTVKTWLQDRKAKISFVYPDTLLNFLRKANVTHVITANLRADATENTGYTASTVERFMALIRFKYPNIMSKIIQMGSDNNEPAVLYQINYDQAGLQNPK